MDSSPTESSGMSSKREVEHVPIEAWLSFPTLRISEVDSQCEICLPSGLNPAMNVPRHRVQE